MKTLITSRLKLRPFILDDAPFIIELVNSPGWLKFIGDRNIHTEEAAQNYLQNGPMKGYSTNGFGLLMVELKDSGTPIGTCGLIKRDTLSDIDIGYALLPEFEGKGFAFEAASAVMDYAKNELKVNRVVAITTKDNERSGKLLNRIGFSFEKNIRLTDDEDELMLFGSV